MTRQSTVLEDMQAEHARIDPLLEPCSDTSAQQAEQPTAWQADTPSLSCPRRSVP